MISERDAGRIVRDWLADGEPVLPAHVFQAVLDDVPRVRQRRRRLGDRLPTIRWPIAAALALLVVALLGLAVATGAVRWLLPAPDPLPFPTVEGRPLEPGRYVIDHPFPVRVSLDVADGWVAAERGASVVALARDRLDGPTLVFTTVEGVYRDPCHPELGLVDPFGPSAVSLAATLAGRPSITASGPQVTTVAGRPALTMTVRAPDRPSGCTPNDPALPLWGLPDPLGLASGQTDRIDIVEVDGVRLVLVTERPKGMSAAEAARVDEVVASLRLGADAADVPTDATASRAPGVTASPEATPASLPQHGHLAGGFYVDTVQLYRPGPAGGPVALPRRHDVALSVPDGWFASDRGIRSREDRPAARLEAWSVLDVHRDPCHTRDAPGRRAALDDLEALATLLRTGWAPVADDSTVTTMTSSSPTRQAWNGRHAWSFELSIAGDVVTSRCDDGRLALWTAPEGDSFIVDPGDRVRLWVIDLDPGLVVLAHVVPAGATVAETQALLAAGASTWIGLPPTP